MKGITDKDIIKAINAWDPGPQADEPSMYFGLDTWNKLKELGIVNEKGEFDMKKFCEMTFKDDIKK